MQGPERNPQHQKEKERAKTKFLDCCLLTVLEGNLTFLRGSVPTPANKKTWPEERKWAEERKWDSTYQ